VYGLPPRNVLKNQKETKEYNRTIEISNAEIFLMVSSFLKNEN
jgi:hypothetical protein